MTMSKHGWTYKKFEDCLKKFKTPSKIKSSEYYRSGLYPVISQEQEYISGYNNSAEKIFHHDKPVVVFGDHSRVVKYVDFDFIVGADGVKILLVRDELNPRFFYYYIKWIDVQSLGYSRHYKVLKENYIPVPPMGEQEAIVAELDKINSAIDELKLQVADLGTLAQATFYDMFGDPVTNPKAWPVKKLGEVAHYSSTRVSATKLTPKSYVGVDNLLKDKQGKCDAAYYPTDGNVTAFEVGDTLLGNIRPYLKKIWYADTEGGVSGDVLVVQINEEMRSELHQFFIYYTLSLDDFFDFDMLHSKGAKMPRGSKPEILKFPICIPPMALQQEFAARVKAIEEAKTELKAQMADMQALLASRMQYWFD